MDCINNCILHYNKLLELLEEDMDSIKYGLQGDLLDAYRSIIDREIDEITNEMSALKQMHSM